MGEAKSRGTKKEREEQAKAAIRGDVEMTRAQAELSADAKFLAYVVHLPESEEFLYDESVSPGVVTRRFCESPGMAARYPTRSEAEKVAATLRGRGRAGVLFDLGKVYSVVYDTE